MLIRIKVRDVRLIALDRISRSLFGFQYIPEIITSSVMRTKRIRPDIVQTILTISAYCTKISAIVPNRGSILDQLHRARLVQKFPFGTELFEEHRKRGVL